MEPRPKKRKGADVLRLGRRSFATQSAISELCRAVETDGLPMFYSRKAQFNSMKKFTNQQTPYGPLMATFVVCGVTLAVQCPGPMIHYCAAHCEGFASLLAETVARHGSDDPWDLIVYADGISPEDTLSKNDKRKFWAIYWSFQQFGQEALGTEEPWFTLAVVRLTELSKLDGGLSHLLGALLDTYIFNPEGVDFSRSGVALALASGVSILRSTSVLFLGDEPALADMCLAKGHAGIKSCMRCANLVLCRYFVEARDAPHNIRSTDVDFNKFEPLTVARLRMMLLCLKDMHPVLNQTQFANLSTRFGFNHSDFNLAMKPYAQFPKSIMFDWMHVYMVSGLLPQEFGKCMRELRRDGAPTGYTDVLAFLDKWIWPRSIQMNLRKIFHVKANKSNLEASFFSCSASELLTIAPVLNLFFATIVAAQGYCTACVTSLCACLDVVELLQAMKNVTVSPALLRDAVARHAASRRAAYGTDIDENSMKMHMALHLPGMLEDFGALFSCWVQERHHRLLTKYAGPRKNTASYERGVMQNITVEQCQALEPRWLDTGLVAPYPPRQATKRILEELGFGATGCFGLGARGCVGLEVARACRCSFGQVMVGDVVGLRDGAEGRIEVGEVVLFLHWSGSGGRAIMSMWEFAPATIPCGHTWRMHATCRGMSLRDTSAIEAIFVYSRDSPSSDAAIVIVPPKWR